MTKSSTQLAPRKERIYTFDFLRGYFIVVIIVDHLWKFPSLWSVMSGEARLWVTAAEGFVMISGFLIGYIRGFKSLKLPFFPIAVKLLRRALMLYVWMVFVSVVYLIVDWQLKSIVPNIPSSPAPKGDWYQAIMLIVTMKHPHLWIYFLYLYAIFLVLSIGAVWLLRKRLSWLVAFISLALYGVGLASDVEWMKWQVLFFFMAIIGFYFEPIRDWWRRRSTRGRASLALSMYTLSTLTITLSYVSVYQPQLMPAGLAAQLNDIFVIEKFTPPRVILSFLWVGALGLLFHTFVTAIKKYTYGILTHLGTHSLSAYIIHAMVICVINALLVPFDYDAGRSPFNFVINTVLGALAVLTVYWLLKIPLVARLIPR